MTSNDDYVLEIIEEKGLVTPEQIEEARQSMADEAGTVVDAMVRKEFVSQAQILEALAYQFGMEVVTLVGQEIPQTVIAQIPTDIARRLGVSHATAIKTIARLKREGLATSRPYRGVFLTPEGEALAARVKSRHRLVVDLLRAVGVPAEAAEQDAEGIEHHVSDLTLAAFSRYLAKAG